MDETLIRRVVREVAAELSQSGPTRPDRQRPPEDGPRVLCVFHGGTRLLDEALAQVGRIELDCSKFSTFTVEAVRDRVCGVDASSQAGWRCSLDRVAPQDLDRVLARVDVVVLPTLCLMTAAKVARMTCDDPGSNVALKALMMGKKVLASSDGFGVLEILTNPRLKREVDSTLSLLREFGLTLGPTKDLYDLFRGLVSGADKSDQPAGPSSALPEHKLITAEVIRAAVAAGRGAVRLAAGGKTTPLARDLAKDYAIKIISVGD